MLEARFEHSPQLGTILEKSGATLLVTTYQAGKLLVFGSRQGQLQVSFLDFDQPMGLAASPTRIALGGFSDGASYALSLGIGNGDLFSHLVAYSPGFYVVPDPVVGTPPVFISHGTFDAVLSFANTRDRIVPTLRDSGHDVTFYEFEGGPEVIAPASTAALDWFFDVT